MKVYIKINGILYDTGRTTLKDSPETAMTVDRDHPLSIKSRVYPIMVIKPEADGMVCLELEGKFSKQDIQSLVYNPWQIFKPSSLTKE